MMSRRTKEAIKTALAMTIAYGIALAMGWDKPMWAGFAVAFISLATVGQSLNKGVMRMFGTLLAAIFSLLLLALFPQERWWFMVGLSLFVGLCTYMMGGTRRQYFWNVAGFVSGIICLESIPATENVFQLAVLRSLETGLGILVYGLVTVLVWPTNTYSELDAAVRQLTTTQHKLYRYYLNRPRNEGTEGEIHTLRMQEIQQFNQFCQALAAAQTDTDEVWEVRQQWQQLQNLFAQLMETLEHWHESLAEVKELNLNRLLPNLAVLDEEMDARFDQMARMLAGKAPKRSPQLIEFTPDYEEVCTLSHFQTAALAVTHVQLQTLETLTRSLFETFADVKGVGASTPRSRSSETVIRESGGWFDLDRLIAAVRVMVCMWVAYLVWIYIEVPGGIGFVIMSTSLGMALASKPQIPVSIMFIPAATSIVFASILYLFVMPQLSSFMGLGLMIFLVTFAICYLFSAPQQMIGRALGLALFVTTIAVSNVQSYSFLAAANTALMFPLIFALMIFTAYIPVSPQPEKAFLHLLGRFFRSSEYLMSTLRWEPTRKPTRWNRWKKAFHTREVAMLPQKLMVWSQVVNTKVVTGTTPKQISALTLQLQALAYRIQGLLAARENPQADFLVRELLTDVRAWRVAVQGTFQHLSLEPAAMPVELLRERLNAILTHLEARIEETLAQATEGELNHQEGEYFYRLLGAYRGVSEAIIEYAKTADAIDWHRWREARF